MNMLLSNIGRRSYIATYFKEAGINKVIGTTDRHGLESEFTVGLPSCTKGYILPSIKSPEYIDSIMELCRRESISMVCSLFDQDCHILSNHLDDFIKIGALPYLPDNRVSSICIDKVKTEEFLNEIEVGSPATFVSIEDFIASRIEYPVVVKPRHGFASLNMFFVKNERELMGCFIPKVHIIQEKLKGEEYSFDILNDLNGKVISCVIKRKLKMRAGETDQAITVKNEKLLSLAVRVGEALGYPGPLDVDLFVSADGAKVLEFNPRFGGGYPLSHAAGAKFPELMVEMTKGNSPKSILGNYQENIVMMKAVQVITKPLSTLVEGYASLGRR